MEERFITKDGKKLRYGFTTGSCAAMAAKAALSMLCEQQLIEEVEVETLNGWNLKERVEHITLNENDVKCSIKKDAGDDPDITNGIDIYAHVQWVHDQEEKLIITGGEGIGRVTKDGLLVKKGEYAINPGPIDLITKTVTPLIPEDKKLLIIISTPQGKKAAEKTFNKQLGIIDGISILGTTGIVEPMSHKAVIDSLKLHLSIAHEERKNRCTFVLGNYGRSFSEKELPIDKDYFIKVGNHIGDMLNYACDYSFEEILIIGHIGKLIKVAGGIFNTHSSISDARLEILASNYGVYSNNIDAVKNIMASNTTEDALQYIEDDSFYDRLALLVKEKCLKHIDSAVKLEVVLFSMTKGMLAKTQGTDELVKRMSINGE